jgi:uncharacterized membrane protein
MSNSAKLATMQQDRQSARLLVRMALWLFEHWTMVFAILLGILVILPFLAPVFMYLGWMGVGQAIYFAYSTLCHQMAQRSFFLFGSQPMYNLAELPLAMSRNEAVNMLTLRDFIGNPGFGWKVAWSDRMVYMFGATWLAAIVFGFVRQRRVIAPLRLTVFIALLLPMGVDGITHLLSDVSGGLAGGFRYNNQWLADLTGHLLPTWFYVGDALGSFNSWMRFISGVCFGIAIVWLLFPYMDRSFQESAELLHQKLTPQAHEAD